METDNRSPLAIYLFCLIYISLNFTLNIHFILLLLLYFICFGQFQFLLFLLRCYLHETTCRFKYYFSLSFDVLYSLILLWFLLWFVVHIIIFLKNLDHLLHFSFHFAFIQTFSSQISVLFKTTTRHFKQCTQK